MILASSGMLFQVAVLGGAFALAGLVVLMGIALRHKRNQMQGPPPLPSGVVGTPYEFSGLIVSEEQAEEASRELPVGMASGFGKVAVAWVKATDAFGVLGLCSFFVFLSFGNLRAADGVDVAKVDALEVLLNFVIFGVLLMITRFLVHRRISLTAWLGLRWRHWPWVFVSPAVVIFMWMVLTYLTLIGYFQWMERMSGKASTQDAVKMLRENQDVTAVGLMALAAVVVAPVVEEVVFRGYIYPAMKRWIGIWPAILFSSMVFAAGHGSAALILPLFILGVILALSYEFTGSIWMPIAIHACFNGATVGLQLLARFGVIPLPE